MVQAVSAAMRSSGVVAGDRIAAVITNSIEAVVLFLATASIGAIYTSTAPDMGAKGILNRYEQIKPKLLFMETEVFYAGKVIDLSGKCLEVLSSLNQRGLQSTILLPSRITGRVFTLQALARYDILSYADFLARGDNSALTFEQLPFNHPLIILYSSGTTGTPKCIVHRAGGILLQIKKELAYCYGLDALGTFFQYTTTGWMMWTLLMGSLSLGARMILYDGSPFHPDIQTFVKMINDQGATVTGLSPRFLSEMRSQGIQPHEVASFEALQSIAVGGSILTPNVHAWAQKAFGPSTRVFIAMGGTDICAAFVVSIPSLQIHVGEISCKSLGIKVEVFDSHGRNIEGTGRAGEMVVTKGHPTVPLFFWGDKSGEKFRKAYFDMFPGIWRQGDFMVVNPKTGGIQILGRSDGVLNPKGIRFGAGEIYSVVEQLEGVSEQVDDCICVGQRRAQDPEERVFLFVKMRHGYSFTKILAMQIKAAIRNQLTARHVPDFMIEVKNIPYTTNGKKIEIAVKQIISGAVLKPSASVANPEALEEYYKYCRDAEVEASRAKL
ncbi:putative NRPS-like protein biosynthetic cluster [Marasmius oreades]|uniref:NRPS-like protein biosynthetic cluster n=1 Tax=Marasmius oreades TaxID=181124 RepID=A0A9P7S3G1_9AGAR|nr:putative NRPS-like protein biosynthetic cluster [Marasmius oreades]KAG7094617.1 putative NRPS-like protein biosynthetic cluster [Marasmius oreades]